MIYPCRITYRDENDRDKYLSDRIFIDFPFVSEEKLICAAEYQDTICNNRLLVDNTGQFYREILDENVTQTALLRHAHGGMQRIYKSNNHHSLDRLIQKMTATHDNRWRAIMDVEHTASHLVRSDNRLLIKISTPHWKCIKAGEHDGTRQAQAILDMEPSYSPRLELFGTLDQRFPLSQLREAREAIIKAGFTELNNGKGSHIALHEGAGLADKAFYDTIAPNFPTSKP